MYPSWLQVEYAIIFFKSVWNNATVEPKKAVSAPIKLTKNIVVCANSKIEEHRIVKKTPAVTIVAAWINADTGVGPSIASGNQVCKPNCADFPTTPKNKKNATKSAITMSNDRRLAELVKEKGAKVKTVKKSILPAKKKN